MCVEKKIYLLLEMERIKHNHSRIPTLFVLPKAGMIATKFVLSGIMFRNGEALDFEVSKTIMEEEWEIKLGENVINFREKGLYETLLKFYKH